MLIWRRCCIAPCLSFQQRIFVILCICISLWFLLVNVNKKLPESRLVNGFDLFVWPTYANLSRCEFSRNEHLGVQKLNCPDIRAQGRTKYRQAELVLTRMLKVFDLIASKQRLRYWLYRGSLLGAVRHRGHNPLDDDLDIAILRDDYLKFIREGVKLLPQDMFLQTEETDPHWKAVPYSNMLAKIRDLRSCTRYCLSHGCKHHDGLQIDIFVIDEDSNGSLFEYFWHPSHHVRYMFGPLKRPYSDVFPLKKLSFDGFSFPVPSQWEKMLEYWYGNYMEFPLNAQMGHVNTDPQHSCSLLSQHD